MLGLAHVPHVGPSPAQHLGAVPDEKQQDQCDGGVEDGDQEGCANGWADCGSRHRCRTPLDALGRAPAVIDGVFVPVPPPEDTHWTWRIRSTNCLIGRRPATYRRCPTSRPSKACGRYRLMMTMPALARLLLRALFPRLPLPPHRDGSIPALPLGKSCDARRLRPSQAFARDDQNLRAHRVLGQGVDVPPCNGWWSRRTASCSRRRR